MCVVLHLLQGKELITVRHVGDRNVCGIETSVLFVAKKFWLLKHHIAILRKEVHN